MKRINVSEQDIRRAFAPHSSNSPLADHVVKVLFGDENESPYTSKFSSLSKRVALLEQQYKRKKQKARK